MKTWLSAIGLPRLWGGAPTTWSIVRRFLPDVAPFRTAIAAAIGLQLVAVALELAQPWALQQVFDRALIGGSPHAKRIVLIGAGLLTAAVLARVLVSHVAGLRVVGTGHALTRALRLRVFRHLVELPPTFHTRQKSGDLLMRLMGDAPMVSTMLVDSTSNLITRAIQVFTTVALMLWVDLRLTLALAIFLPVIMISARLLAARLTIATRKQRRKEGDMADYMQESLGSAAVIQSLGREGDAVRAFAKTNRRNARAGMKTARAAARLSSTVEALLGVALGLTVLLGGLRVLEPGSGFSVGKLIVFLSYVRGLMKPLRSAAKHQARVAKGLACGERLLRVIDEDRPVRSNAGDRTPAMTPSRLAFEAVTYAYPDHEPALRDVTLEFVSGDYVAIFGESGAGKSTLAALALRLMDPTAGEVLLDGVPLPEFDVDRLRTRFALSMQATVLFGATVRENLQLGVPDAADETLWQALEDAGGADMVRALPGGLDFQLGAAGMALSGGQRKRICLARSFLRGAPILIVDEPFNGLDGIATQRVGAKLRQHANGGGIVLVITHDVSSLDGFDRVLFLRDGTIYASGRHAELRANAPEYQRLVLAAEGGTP